MGLCIHSLAGQSICSFAPAPSPEDFRWKTFIFEIRYTMWSHDKLAQIDIGRSFVKLNRAMVGTEVGSTEGAQWGKAFEHAGFKWLA